MSQASPASLSCTRSNTSPAAAFGLVRQKRFVLDGEAVVLGVDGVSDFDDLVSRMHDDEVRLYAFDGTRPAAAQQLRCR